MKIKGKFNLVGTLNKMWLVLFDQNALWYASLWDLEEWPQLVSLVWHSQSACTCCGQDIARPLQFIITDICL